MSVSVLPDEPDTRDAGGERPGAVDPWPAAPRPSGMAATRMLAWREWVRFFRQRNRVIAAVCQPLLFWLLFGAGMHGSFQWADSQNFLEYFLPGTVMLVVLFTAIFATISVIEDRREGFMQGVLVAPVGRWPILAGKVLGGGAIAWVQAAALLALACLIGTVPVTWSLLPALAMLAVMSAALVGVGMVVAWPMESTQGFHAIMNLVLMPLWLLSGAFFPLPPLGGEPAVGPLVLHWVMRANPLSYSLAEVRRLMYPAIDFAATGWAPSSAVCWIVSIGFLVAILALAGWLMRGSVKADLVS